MMNELNSTEIFYFKQFALKIKKGVFPITTDSVLLGSWIDTGKVKTILDLGCGSGILSLMLAQRSNANILAVDMDPISIECAKENCENSPWKSRIHFFNAQINELKGLEPFSMFATKVDLIVSNPPYFRQQLVSHEDYMIRSKHQHAFDFESLARVSEYFLEEEGRACFVIPMNSEADLTFQMYALGFQLNKMTMIRHNQNSDFSLALLEFRKLINRYAQNEITLYNDNGSKTEEFYKLTKEYYLK
jgi:tRNA1Val (adenine37-N6)-methyltransferase